MLKEQARLLAASIFTLDLSLVAAAFFLAYYGRAEWLPTLFPSLSPFYSLQTYLPLLPLVLVIWAILLQASGCYRSHRTVPLLEEAWDILKVCSSGLAILALAVYVFRLEDPPGNEEKDEG